MLPCICLVSVIQTPGDIAPSFGLNLAMQLFDEKIWLKPHQRWNQTDTTWFILPFLKTAAAPSSELETPELVPSSPTPLALIPCTLLAEEYSGIHLIHICGLLPVL